jgi:hypothetical protein
VGAPRRGTTSLYFYLREHPQIFMPGIKEPHFFAFSGKPTYYKHNPIVWKLKDYAGLFAAATEGQVLGEASPGYLYYHERAIENIKKYVPAWEDLRIIMILRNPALRAFSHYLVLRLTDRESRGFDEAINSPLTEADDFFSGHSATSARPSRLI